MTSERTCCGPDCCGETSEQAAGTAGASSATAEASAEAVREKVREGYGQIARSGQWSSVDGGIALRGDAEAPGSSQRSGGCCGGTRAGEATGQKPDATGGGCCGGSTLTADQVAAAVGYGASDLESIPQGANMGLSCGNPTAIAGLRRGEVALDLGSGGGFDCFIAGPKVGAAGRVIGVDMTADMITRARGNIEAYRRQSGLDNVEFRLGEIEHLPVGDASVDVVISNCVINLSPDKPQVWREIARVLKPGGRVAVSDLALLQPLPAAVQADVEALVGCIAGASLVEDIRRMAEAAGLVDIQLTSKPQYIDAMTSWQDPLYQRIAAALPAGSKMSAYVTSLDIAARKP